MADENFRVNMDELEDVLDEMQQKQETAIMMYAQTGAKKFEAYAKENRRWVDRTGRARKTLVGYVTRYSHSVRVYIAHGVFYGIYLELCHEKKYAILAETIKKKSKEILEGFQGLLEELV